MAKGGDKRRKAGAGFRRLCGAMAAFLGTCTLAGFLGGLWWVFDLASHFRIQYAVLACLLLVLLAWLRRWRWAAFMAACLAANAAALAPFLGGPARCPLPAGPARSVLWWNIGQGNADHEAFGRWVEEEAFDLVALCEFTPAWEEYVERELSGLYPWRHHHARRDSFGLSLLSRHPLEDMSVFVPQGGRVPVMRGRVDLDGQRLQLALIHPMPPVRARAAASRDRILEVLPEALGEGPSLVVGDFNTAPWNRAFARLLRESRLQWCGRIVPTWPAWMPPMRIPLDYCLGSPEIRIMDLQAGPALGSDHLSLRARFAVAAAGAPGGLVLR